MKDKIVWLDKGFFLPYIGFCPSEKAWNKWRKEHKDTADWVYPDNDACISSFSADGNKLILIMSINEKFDNHKSMTAIAALFAHEAMHIWRRCRLAMGEVNPSEEFEAYAVQWIMSQLLWAYGKSGRPKRKGWEI